MCSAYAKCMGKRRYSDDERAACLAALASNGGDVAKTAREVGVPYHTLKHWADGKRHPEARQMANGKKPDLADMLEDLAYRAVRTSRRGLRHLKADRAAVVAGIAIEKMQLLRHQPTANVDARHEHIVTITAADLDAARAILGVAASDIHSDGGPEPVGSYRP
jgi:transposase-like protein